MITPWTDGMANFLARHERWLDVMLIVLAAMSLLMLGWARHKPRAKALFVAYLLLP